MKDDIAISRTKSDDLTKPMHMIDHTCARLDGPPVFLDEDDTEVNGIPVEVVDFDEDCVNTDELPVRWEDGL